LKQGNKGVVVSGSTGTKFLFISTAFSVVSPLSICSVKDVNQGLVDDGLVEMEKVGASNVFFGR